MNRLTLPLALSLAALTALPALAAPSQMSPDAGANPAYVVGGYDLSNGKYKLPNGAALPSHCQAYASAAPIGTLEVTADIADVMLKADTYMVALVRGTTVVNCVKDESHQGGAQLLFRPLVAGTYEVWVGEQYNKPSDAPREAVVKLLNTKRGYAFAWEAEAKPVTLSGKVDAPIVVETTTRAAGTWDVLREVDEDCRGLSVTTEPFAVVDVAEETAVSVLAGSGADVSLVTLALDPKAEAGKLPVSCATIDDRSEHPRPKSQYHAVQKTLSKGRYAYFVAAKQPVDAALTLVVLDKEQTGRAPFSPSASPTIGDAVALRAAPRLFPQLSVGGDLAMSDANREALLMAFPLEAFVYPVEDLGPEQAVSGFKVLTSRGATGALEDRALETPIVDEVYPKKGEPLVYLGDQLVLTLDGAIFQITKRDVLATTPEGERVLPTAARPEWIQIDDGVAIAASEDQKTVEGIAAARKKWKACSDRTWKAPTKKMAGLSAKIDRINRQRRISTADRRRIDALSAQIGKTQAAAKKKEVKVCKNVQHHAFLQSSRKTLILSRAARHEAIRAKVAQRFE